MSWNKIKELQEQRASYIAELSKIANKAEGEKRSLNGDETAAFDQIKKDIGIVDSRIKNLGEVAELEKSIANQKELNKELRSGTGLMAGLNAADSRDDKEQRKAFQNYLLTGETRDISTGSAGVVLPTYFNNSYIAAMKSSLSVIANGAVAIDTVDMANFYFPTIDDTANTSQSGAEGFTANAATDPTIASPYLGAYRYTPGALSYTIEMASTNFEAFEQTLQNVAVRQIARTVNGDTSTGNGTNKCKGYMTSATVGVTAASSTTFTYDELLSMVYSMDPAYRYDPTTRICASSAAIKKIRGFVDGSSRLIYLPNDKLSLDGIPVVEDVSLATSGLTTGASPVAVVNFGNYYFRSVNGTSVVRDPYSKASTGKIVLTVNSWHDGKLAVPQAVRTLKLA